MEEITMVKIFICGDIVNYKTEDGLICSESIEKIIKSAEYSICNFEAPIRDSGSPQPKSGPHHSQLRSTVTGLKKQGFDLFCLANNHIMDYGADGLTASIQAAQLVDVETIGAGHNYSEAYMPLIKEIGNMKFGLINACEAQFGVIDYSTPKNQAGYAWINHTEIDEKIKTLKTTCDFVIVLAHAGLEHYDIPQQEWKYRYKQLCDIGADIIVGSHPHVPQGYEQYNNSLIFYSLGNFFFDSKAYANKEDRSYSLLLNFEKGKKADFNTVFHHKEKGKVTLSSKDKQIDIELLNKKLKVEYAQYQDAMSLEVYRKYIRKSLLYSLLPIPYYGNLYDSFKRLVNSLIGRNKIDKDLLSLHLIRNESYLYAARHAMTLISKEKYERR